MSAATEKTKLTRDFQMNFTGGSIMSKMNIAAGIGVGLAVGGAAALLSGSKMGMSKRAMKKKAGKAMKAVEGIMGDMKYMFR